MSFGPSIEMWSATPGVACKRSKCSAVIIVPLVTMSWVVNPTDAAYSTTSRKSLRMKLSAPQGVKWVAPSERACCRIFLARSSSTPCSRISHTLHILHFRLQYTVSSIAISCNGQARAS